MLFLADGRDWRWTYMVTLLFVSSLWTVIHCEDSQTTRNNPSSASTNRAYLFDFLTCPECTDGLNDTAARRCYDPEDPSVSSVYFYFDAKKIINDAYSFAVCVS